MCNLLCAMQPVFAYNTTSWTASHASKTDGHETYYQLWNIFFAKDVLYTFLTTSEKLAFTTFHRGPQCFGGPPNIL